MPISKKTFMRDDIKPQKNLPEILLQIIDLLEEPEIVKVIEEQSIPHVRAVPISPTTPRLMELQQILQQLHHADVAFIIENLPLDERHVVWDLIDDESCGMILLEVSDAVRESLIADMENDEIIDAAEHLDSDEIADLVPDLPQDVVLELLTALDSKNRAQVQSVLTFPEDTVGALMDFDMVLVREDINIDVVLRYLRRLGELPAQTDQLFVVDRAGRLKGLLPLRNILISDPDTSVAQIMTTDPIFFYTDDPTRGAVQLFERYDLISAPVIDAQHQLVGCIGIDVVMDFINETNQKEILNQVGLNEEEDLFAPLWKSGKNRWLWLAINLVTAFVASRVIGAFEGSIEKLAALAALMPIVAGIGGNTGNQTMTLIIRGLALQQINSTNFLYLLVKELGIGLMNGALWGSIVGVFAYLLYQQFPLALVMTTAMMLNLLLASLIGVFIPLTLHKLGRDPALGGSVILTAITDSMGFFIFLGLATIFLF